MFPILSSIFTQINLFTLPLRRSSFPSLPLRLPTYPEIHLLLFQRMSQMHQTTFFIYCSPYCLSSPTLMLWCSEPQNWGNSLNIGPCLYHLCLNSHAFEKWTCNRLITLGYHLMIIIIACNLLWMYFRSQFLFNKLMTWALLLYLLFRLNNLTKSCSNIGQTGIWV